MAGLFYNHALQRDFAHVVHPDLPELLQQFYGATIEEVLGVPPYLGKWVAYDEISTTTSQFAVFANADYKLTDALTLTLGGRWSHYATDIHSFIAGPFNGGEQTFDARATGDAFTPRFGLSFTPDARSLYYVTVAKCFRPGGANPQTTNATPACQSALAASGLRLSPTYRPDSLWSYEAGYKRRAFDNRLSIEGSAFHIRWSGIQSSQQIVGCGFSAIFNLGAADANGFDLALQAVPTDNLRFEFAASYTDAHFDGTIPGIVTKGDAIAGASVLTGQAVPPWNVRLSVKYDFRVLNRDAYVWVQDVYHSANKGPFNSHNPANVVVYDPLLPADPVTNMIDAKLGIRVRQIDASLFVDNLTDEHPQLSVFNVFYPDPRLWAATWRPRTFGARVAARF